MDAEAVTADVDAEIATAAAVAETVEIAAATVVDAAASETATVDLGQSVRTDRPTPLQPRARTDLPEAARPPAFPTSSRARAAQKRT